MWGGANLCVDCGMEAGYAIVEAVRSVWRVVVCESALWM